MTPKKYLWLKILPPKNTPSPPVGLRKEFPPLGVQYVSLYIGYSMGDGPSIWHCMVIRIFNFSQIPMYIA